MKQRIDSQLIRRIAKVLLLAVVATATMLTAENANPTIAPPNSNPQGVSYALWGAAWWQWAFSLPASVPLHPLFTQGPVDCSYGQSGHVWFLAGMFASGSTTRSCSVPTGTRLFFPLYNNWVDNVGTVPPFTIEQLKEVAAVATDAVGELHARVDGVPLQNLFAYRAAYDPFGYTVPATDNLLQFFFGAKIPGTDWPTTFVFPAASDGYWLMLEPLPPGNHIINFGGASKDGTFQIDITYEIKVVPRG